jgi:hypothetical protein
MLFRCSIRGENFPGELIGERGLYGFYTTRWVEAISEEEAETLALESLKSEPTFQQESPKLREQSKARVYFEEIVPVRTTKQEHVNAGASWFEMER